MIQHPTASFFLPLEPGEPIHLARCFDSGQIFRWRLAGQAWVGSLRGTVLALREAPGGIAVEVAGDAVTPEEVAVFLGLSDRLAEIVPRIDTDAVMRACLEALAGLRILRQDPWECLITYICSAWNNIPKIERGVGLIARRWGRAHRLVVGGQAVEVASFPPPEALAAASEADLRACGLGYRAPYVAQTARKIAAGGLDLEALRRAGYAEALAALLRLPGIGRKVADCILLFSLDKPEAVPVDVWVRRVIHEYYGRELREEQSGPAPGASAREGEAPAEPVGEVSGSAGAAPSQNPPVPPASLGNREYDAIQRFAWRRWGRWAGYAQQYLFYGKRLGII